MGEVLISCESDMLMNINGLVMRGFWAVLTDVHGLIMNDEYRLSFNGGILDVFAGEHKWFCNKEILGIPAVECRWP